MQEIRKFNLYSVNRYFTFQYIEQIKYGFTMFTMKILTANLIDNIITFANTRIHGFYFCLSRPGNDFIAEWGPESVDYLKLRSFQNESKYYGGNRKVFFNANQHSHHYLFKTNSLEFSRFLIFKITRCRCWFTSIIYFHIWII